MAAAGTYDETEHFTGVDCNQVEDSGRDPKLALEPPLRIEHADVELLDDEVPQLGCEYGHDAGGIT